MPSWCGVPSTAQTRSLTTNGTPLEGPVGRLGRAAPSSNSGWITALSVAVERLDALDRALHELLRRHLPGADEVGLGGGV